MNLANGDSAEYWKGAEEGKLLFQKCQHCGTVQFPPRFHCGHCWETDIEWIESSGKGKVETFTVVQRAPLPSFRDKVPYVIAAINVEEGPRMITSLLGDKAMDVKIGDDVVVDFVQNEDGNTLPVFKHA